MAPLRQRWARNWGAESRSQASRIFLVHSLPHPRYLVLPLLKSLRYLNQNKGESVQHGSLSWVPSSLKGAALHVSEHQDGSGSLRKTSGRSGVALWNPRKCSESRSQ